MLQKTHCCIFIKEKYLNLKQALADTANFREFFASKFKLSDSNKWVVFGGSYAGTVAAFYRLKYPHLGKLNDFSFELKINFYLLI